MKDRESKSIAQPVAFAIRRRRMLLLPLALAGCADPYIIGPGSGGTAPPPPGPQRIATLDVEGDVELTQGSRRFRGRDGNALFRGDEVRTFAGSYALLSFADGNRVWLDYDTRVRLGSVFTFFGRVFAAVSGVFQVDSDFVDASTEGTEFTVTVGRGGPGVYSVAVRSGAVRCTPRRGRWRPGRLVAGQRLRARSEALPVIDGLDARESQEEFGWVGVRRAPDRIPPSDRTEPPVQRRPIPQEKVEPPAVPRRPIPQQPPQEPVIR